MSASFVVSDAVRETLRTSVVTPRGEGTWSLVLPGALERAAYVAVNKVLTGAGGRWDRKSASHLFDVDPRPLLSGASQTGVAVNVKTARQAFYSPPEVAEFVVGLADLTTSDHDVLEPSAGGGALVRAALACASRLRIACWDSDPAYGTHFEDVKASGADVTLFYGDFLEVRPTKIFSRVLMNPPFAKSQDVAHVLHALRFLRPGGVLVSVMSGSSNQTRTIRLYEDFLDLLARLEHEWHDLPPGSFKASGTNVNACVLKVTR